MENSESLTPIMQQKFESLDTTALTEQPQGSVSKAKAVLERARNYCCGSLTEAAAISVRLLRSNFCIVDHH